MGLNVVLLVLLVGTLSYTLAQTQQVNLYPGQSVEVVCNQNPTIEPTSTSTTMPTSTSTIQPTNTAIPPTSTPIPSTSDYGVTRINQSDWQTAKSELGVNIVEYRVSPSTSDADILSGLSYAQSLGVKVLLHIYDSPTNTNAPFYLDNGNWAISARGIEILNLVENNLSVWALYTLHEPYSSSEYVCDADCQREMYAFLKQYTSIPLYMDIGSLYFPYNAGYQMTDGMCDYCATFPCTFRGEWTSQQSIAETLSRIDNDRWVQTNFMPNSKLVFLLNTYTLGDGSRYRMPTSSELATVRDYMCPNVHLYYPWSGYDLSLDDVPELYPVIAQGCGQQPYPTNTPIPTNTAFPNPTNTPTMQPTSTPTMQPTSTPIIEPTNTPPPGNAIIVDHTAYADNLTQAQLDYARSRVHFFNHASIGSNILDGMRLLSSDNPTRYAISIVYSSGTNTGINEYQAGSNGRPLTKVSGFSANIKTGHDLAFMKFCTGDIPCVQGDTPISQMWAAYRDMMIQYDNVIWWTIPIIASNNSRAYCNQELAQFNNLVRDYVNANGGILFDIADIESQGGTITTSQGYEAAYPAYTSDGAHLSVLGQRRVASALWVLLAQ